MNIEDLESALDQIDRSNTGRLKIDVSDKSVLTVVKPAYEYEENVDSEVSAPGDDGSDGGGGGGGYSYTKSVPAELLLKLDLDKINITDEFVDERMKIAANPKKASSGYLPGVKVMQKGASAVYKVVEDYSYAIDYYAIERTPPEEVLENYSGNSVPLLCTVTVKKGFEYDRASIPRIFWGIISKDDLSNVPPLFHDFFYRFGGHLPKSSVKPYTNFVRDEADNLFRHLMERTGVSSWRAFLAYKAVSLASGFAWKSSD